MASKTKKIKIGIVGCGAIGSRIAKSIENELKDIYQLTGLYDIKVQKSRDLERSLKIQRIVKSSLDNLLKTCELMVEAVNATNTRTIIYKALKAKCHVLAMSVGQLLNASDIFRLAGKNQCYLLLPSGAIAGIDAIKAISSVHIQSITLTTRKSISGFADLPYLMDRGIDLSQITKETILFEGDVDSAVKFFPQNINVAATIALASKAKKKITIRMITSPTFTTNSHEIEIVGDFGRLVTRTENVVCPDNPKTSYLAVLSAIQTLKEFGQNVKIGT